MVVNSGFGGFEVSWIYLKWSQFMIHTMVPSPYCGETLKVFKVDPGMCVQWGWTLDSGVLECDESIEGGPKSWFIHSSMIHGTSLPWVHIVDRHWNCSKSVQPCPLYGTKHWIRGFWSVLNSTRVVPTHDSYIVSWSMVPSPYSG